MKRELIDIIKISQEGYTPLVDYQTWRVAVLKFCDDVRVDRLDSMQRHLETDEVFVLLEGSCVLISGGNGERPGEVECVSMVKNQLYNVKKGVWHTHALDEEGSVLIIENQDTCDKNSPTESLNREQIEAIQTFF
jgi:ureidoglycolate hydrolase